MAIVFLGLGSNLGDRAKNIQQAIAALEGLKAIEVVKKSSLIETEPIEAIGPMYLNAAIEVNTELKPKELLEQIHSIENGLGRLRQYKNSPRVIDIDILLYNKQKVDEVELKVPHPKILERNFVIKPLSEILPGARELIEGIFDSKVDILT